MRGRAGFIKGDGIRIIDRVARYAVAAILILPAVRSSVSTRKFESPDKQTVVIVSDANNGKSIPGSRIEFRNAAGRILLAKSYVSRDAEHDFGIQTGRWTGDSQFFVFSMHGSGGHQPWHIPTFVYSRGQNRITSLDDKFGPVTGAFKLLPSDSLETFVISNGETLGKMIVISLTHECH